MARKLPNKAITDFSGGIRKDKSDYQKADNELERVVNFTIDDRGRAKVRGGSHQFGTTLSNTIDNSFFWEVDTGSGPTRTFLINNRDANADIWQLIGTRITSDITTTTDPIPVDNVSSLAASGTVEIDGDVITYTGLTGGLSGTSGISEAHKSGAAVNQWQVVTAATQTDGAAGVYYAPLGRVLFLASEGGAATWNGTTMSNVADGDSPDAIFSVTYRQRIFEVHQSFNFRLFFSDVGDSTAWTSTSWIDVEGGNGESITGLKVSPSDELLIFKANSTHAYNEVTLKERSSSVGAYSHRVIQEIDGLVYTFCPRGVFVTNGSSFRKISDPIDDYLKGFQPTYETTIGRLVTNTFAAQYEDKYILYIGDITTPEVLTGVALVYNTTTQAWSVWSGLDNLTHLVSLPSHIAGGGPLDATDGLQKQQVLFGGTSSGKFYRFFTDAYVDGDGNRRLEGSTVEQDFISDASGTPISAEIQTKLYSLGSVGMKDIKYVRVLSEGHGFNVSYRLETETGLSNWKSLGEVDRRNKRFKLPNNTRAYRIAIKVTFAGKKGLPALEGIVFEDVMDLEDTR